jgi:hypothetical protein
MGKRNAEAYGRRNSGEGAVIVKPTRILAEKDLLLGIHKQFIICKLSHSKGWLAHRMITIICKSLS